MRTVFVPMATYIDKIGLELELAVKRPENPDKSYPEVDNFDATHDGSISTSESGFKAREYVSNPTDYKSDWDNEEMSELESGIYQLYKKHDAFGNDSMGLHLHVSFNKQHYFNSLCSMNFYEFFMDRVKDSDLYDRNSRLRERVRGVQYAQPYNSSNELQRDARGSRNYKHFTYRKHMKTIEFRLMPAFDSKRDVMDAVNLITSAINSFLWNKHHEFEQSIDVKNDGSSLEDTENLEEQASEVFQHV